MVLMPKTLPIMMAIALSSVTTNAIAQTIPATIGSISDGDTLRVDRLGERVTVRLGCIDAPERDQPGGEEAGDRPLPLPLQFRLIFVR